MNPLYHNPPSHPLYYIDPEAPAASIPPEDQSYYPHASQVMIVDPSTIQFPCVIVPQLFPSHAPELPRETVHPYAIMTQAFPQPLPFYVQAPLHAWQPNHWQMQLTYPPEYLPQQIHSLPRHERLQHSLQHSPDHVETISHARAKYGRITVPIMLSKEGDVISPTQIISPSKSPKRTYRLIKRLGKGSSGTVYKAEVVKQKAINGKLKTNKDQCAIKISVGEGIYVRAQGREEDFVIKLNQTQNENIIRFAEGFSIIDLSTNAEQRCTIYELMDQDLWDYLNEKDWQVTINDLQKIARQVIKALVLLNSNKIIHTDLKLENILVTGNLQIKLADFGLARFKKDVSQLDDIQTVSYRSPEVAIGMPYDEKIDMWSLGVILAAIYTGKSVFTIDKITNVLSRDNKKYVENVGILQAVTNMLGPIPEEMVNESNMAEYINQINTTCSYDPNTFIRFLFRHKYEHGTVNDQNILAHLTDEETQLLDLLQKMLMLDPKTRISAEEACLHPFITANLQNEDHDAIIEAPLQNQLKEAGSNAENKESDTP